MQRLDVSGRPAEAAEVAARATEQANALDAGFLLPSMRRLRGTALIELGRYDEAVTELEAAYAACEAHGVYESGFVLAELARATESSDPAAAGAYRTRSAAALADLGWVG